MVTGVVVGIIVVIIAADAFAAIPVKIIAVINVIAAAIIIVAAIIIAATTVIIAVSTHVPEKKEKLMRLDLETAVIIPPADRTIAAARSYVYIMKAVRMGRFRVKSFKAS